MSVLTQEIKDKIRAIAQDRLKDGNDIVIAKAEINSYAKMLEELFISGEFILDEEE